jgi:hypothetical protein
MVRTIPILRGLRQGVEHFKEPKTFVEHMTIGVGRDLIPTYLGVKGTSYIYMCVCDLGWVFYTFFLF